jgi:hypothetical protein
MAARSAVLLTLAWLLAACGGDPAADPAVGSVSQELRAPRPCRYSYTEWSACDATGTQTRTVTSATPAKCTGTPVTTQSCTPPDPTTANPCWTPPPDFYTALQVQVEAQPPYMTGYGGQIANPFPDNGATHFSTIQIARATAMHLDSYFGRCAFRFDVDGTTDMMQSNGYRAEFQGADQAYLRGETYEVRFSMYFASDYANSSWTDWNMIGQFHSPDFSAWGLHTAGGYLMMGPPGAPPDSLRVPMPSRNVWHDFVWTVHFASDSTGWAKLVVDGVTLIDFHGQTFHANEPSYYPKYGSYLAQNRYSQVTYNTGWQVTKLP